MRPRIWWHSARHRYGGDGVEEFTICFLEMYDEIFSEASFAVRSIVFCNCAACGGVAEFARKAAIKKASSYAKKRAKDKALRIAKEKAIKAEAAAKEKLLKEADDVMGGYHGQVGAKPKPPKVKQDNANWSAVENGPIDVVDKFMDGKGM